MAASRVALPLTAARVRAAVRTVLDSERRGLAGRSRQPPSISVTFLSRPLMQRLNRQWRRHDRPTDVIAFALPEPDGRLVGDIYICPAEARASAHRLRIPVETELIRLVVHGTLHTLGWDHPVTSAREQSPMWRRQERYVNRLT